MLAPAVQRVAGAVVAYRSEDEGLCAAVVLLSVPALALLEVTTWCGAVPAPYRPGFLARREAPAVLAALARLRGRPSVLLVRGHGRAHPDAFGLACAVGAAANIPTVGVAKSRLIGRYGPVPDEPGAWVPLVHSGTVVGAVVRTRPGVRPVFVSAGHALSLEEAVAVVLASSPHFRWPEPLRQAHARARLALAKGNVA